MTILFENYYTCPVENNRRLLCAGHDIAQKPSYICIFFVYTIISCSVSRPVLCNGRKSASTTKILLTQETESVPMQNSRWTSRQTVIIVIARTRTRTHTVTRVPAHTYAYIVLPRASLAQLLRQIQTCRLHSNASDASSIYRTCFSRASLHRCLISVFVRYVATHKTHTRS